MEVPGDYGNAWAFLRARGRGRTVGWDVARSTAIRKPGKKQIFRSSSQSSFVLILIGLFKLFKALLLIALGVGAIRYLHKDLGTSVMHWIEVLRVDPENRFVHRFLVRVFRVTPKQLKELSVGTFLYAGLFATEGIGLLMRKRWAEYFTIITTGALIPLEVYEMARHFTITKLVVTLVNVAIVWYLAARVRSR
ncbi:MAG: DUF2127 domain-containing protein [Acidobacteriia bacterium]|nr:DUF2127 domain-containing protein [Terriglobia bacterium]